MTLACAALFFLAQHLDWGSARVEVRPGGGLGRVHLERDFHAEVARLEASLATGTTWRARAFVFREIDVSVNGRVARRRFTDEEVEKLHAVARDFARCVRAYSLGRMRLDLDVRTIEAPLTRISGAEKPGYSAWTDVTAEHIGPFVDDTVDSVIVYFPSAGLPVPFWGGTTGGDSFKKAGYTCVCVLDAIDPDTYTEVTLHEWLHQADWARAERSGYVGLPDLHGAEELGYRPDTVRRGWMDWYRDFMEVYFAPETWRRLSMRTLDPDLPRARFDGGFVRAWRVSPPFDNAEDKGFDPPQVDERDPPVASWRAVESGDTLDLWSTTTPNENVVAYLHVYVKAPPGPARLWIGSDDGVKAWLNSVLVHERHAHRPVRADQDAVDVVLAEGWNRILLKVDQGGGGWGACLRVSRPDGTALDGVEFRADPPAEGVVPPGEYVPREPTHEFAWRDVRDDPFKRLPLLDPRDLGVTGGAAFLALGPAPGERLEFAARGTARRGDLWLVRCDLMDLVADLDARYEDGELREGDLEDHLLGWVSIAGRLAFVARRDPGFEPACDLDLTGARAGAAFVHLTVRGDEAVLRATEPVPRPEVEGARVLDAVALRGGREWRFTLAPGEGGLVRVIDAAWGGR